MALFKKDIALLVLQYLDDEGLKNVYRIFCQESKHLGDEWQALQRGLKRANFSKSLDKCLIEHAKIEAMIREFMQCENLKLDAGCDTDKKVEQVLRHFRPGFRAAVNKQKRRFSNVDKSESCMVVQSPKRMRGSNNESYYSLMIVDTDTEGETVGYISSNGMEMLESTAYDNNQGNDFQGLDVEQKEEIITTARDTLLDMPDLFSTIVAEKINALPVDPSSDLNPKVVIEELEKDQRFNDVFQELLEITATQNDLSDHEETEVVKELVEEHRELRQRVNKINYNEVAKGKVPVTKKEKPVPKKRARKKQPVQKFPSISTDERIVEIINENGEIIRTKVQIDANSIQPLGASTNNVQQFVPSMPSLSTPVSKTPQYVNGITVLSSIPVQCVPHLNQPQIDPNTIVLPCRPTPSGNNIIVDVTPNTFKFISDITVDAPDEIQNQETLEIQHPIQVPLTQEMIEAQPVKATPENLIKAIDKQKVSKCLSTPSRKFPHVRTLNFVTPEKLRTILDKSQNESNVTVIDKRMPSSCPPEIKGLCEDQGMKSDVEGLEGPTDEGSEGKIFFCFVFLVEIQVILLFCSTKVECRTKSC